MPYLETPNLILCASNLLVAGAIALVSRPLLRGRVPPNQLYGFRFAKAFESEETWYRVNREGARRFLRWAAVLAAVGVLALFVPLDGGARLAAFTFAPLLILIPAWTTYRWAQRR